MKDKRKPFFSIKEIVIALCNNESYIYNLSDSIFQGMKVQKINRKLSKMISFIGF